MQDGVIGRMSVAPEKGTGVSRISCPRVAGVGQRMEDALLEAVWVHEKRLRVPSRRSITIWDYKVKGKPPRDSCK